MFNPNEGIVGEIKNLPISDLRLDLGNPRFELAEHEKSQSGLANKMILGYDVMTLAESIARNGFFANEPLVAIPSTSEAGKYIVIEGNRRLTALKCLCDEVFRKDVFQREFWEKLSVESEVSGDVSVPVTIVEDRDKINPILGFRHISGINSWQPLAQARFIARMIDHDGLTFEQTAESVGKAKADVANMYRNQAIVNQAAASGFEVSRLETSFSLLTVAMGSPALRQFVSAPLGGDIAPQVEPIPEEKIPELKEMLGWLFGSGEEPPVINDSREINKLGKVVQVPVGLDTLRNTKDLKQAQEAISTTVMDPLTRLLNRLKAANEASTAAFDDIADYTDDAQVKALVSSIKENAENLADLTGSK